LPLISRSLTQRRSAYLYANHPARGRTGSIDRLQMDS